MITACGSAVYAGSMSKYVIEELCRIPVEADLASELRYRNPLVDEHTLLVVVSQSGETANAIAAMKECKARSARVLAIENVLGWRSCPCSCLPTMWQRPMDALLTNRRIWLNPLLWSKL